MAHGFGIFVGISLLQLAVCYPTFQDNIPNGELVPSPCNPNYVWKGVGHLVKGGGGPRNPFGIDFMTNGYTWSESLCMMDSDGDGKTNGEELGDPECKWTKNDGPPSTIVGLSHPGICEPLDSAQCQGKNDFLECGAEEFECEALSDPDLVSHTVRLSPTPVPAEETTYMCQILDLPTDNDYHLVAVEPYIDNVNVMHHILVYGCKEEANITAMHRSPYQCFMTGLEGCEEILGVWAVGSNGVCYHEQAGFRVGQNGYKTVLIEMHWNNPMEVDTYTDSSGMTLYLTPNLRPNEAGMLLIGQSFLMIPPRREKYSVNSSCSSSCTNKRMEGNINVIGTLNHMHYLGISAKTYMVDHDGEEHVIAEDPVYSYDSPKFYIFDKPFEVEPGYEIRLNCDFKSTSRSKTTFYGEGTSDEMCYAFLMYYPKNNFATTDCVSTGPVDPCGWEEPVVEGCNIWKLFDPTDADNVKRYTDVTENCRIGVCLEECKEVVREIFKNPCFQWPISYLLQNEILQNDDPAMKFALHEYYYKMDSCAADLAREKCKDDDHKWDEPDVSGSQSAHLAPILLMITTALFSVYF